jgi:hypothetical protein
MTCLRLHGATPLPERLPAASLPIAQPPQDSAPRSRLVDGILRPKRID